MSQGPSFMNGLEFALVFIKSHWHVARVRYCFVNRTLSPHDRCSCQFQISPMIYQLSIITCAQGAELNFNLEVVCEGGRGTFPILCLNRGMCKGICTISRPPPLSYTMSVPSADIAFAVATHSLDLLFCYVRCLENEIRKAKPAFAPLTCNELLQNSISSYNITYGWVRYDEQTPRENDWESLDRFTRDLSQNERYSSH